jgi:hypothetical protein
MEQVAPLIDKPLIFSPVWPFVFATLAAGLFGYLAFRFRQSIALWAGTAGLSTLVLATCAAGLFHAISLPYSSARVSSLQSTAMLLTLVLIAASAALVFFLETNRQRNRASAQSEPPGPATQTSTSANRPQ